MSAPPDKVALLKHLSTLLPSQLEVLIFRLGVPQLYVRSGSHASRTVDLIRYLDYQGRLGELATALEGETNQQAASKPSKNAYPTERLGLLAGTTRPGYITKVELRNIRSFQSLDLDLRGSRQSLVIGRNGTCKSTLLRALALALSGPSDTSALLARVPGGLLGTQQSEGSIALELADAAGRDLGTINLVLTRRDGAEVIAKRTPTRGKHFFICGYGTSRSITSPQNTQGAGYRQPEAVATLFDNRASLIDPELMLRRLEDYLGPPLYDKTIEGLFRVLGLDSNHKVHVGRGGGVFISGPSVDGLVPLAGWADGYRLTFQWLIDLYGWAMHAGTIAKDGRVRGILLMDEIEQHLHPVMQAELLAHLRRFLPEVQLIATTHSPIVALGAGAVSLIPLHREGDQIVVRRRAAMEGYSVEDALTDEALFDAPAFPPETQEKLQTYHQLTAKAPEERTQDDKDKLAQVAQDLSLAPSDQEDAILSELQRITELLKRSKEAP
jgi:hypothetical protein